MIEAKTLRLPYIPELDKACNYSEFEKLLEKAQDNNGPGKGKVDTVNWPEDFPFAPSCRFSAGWCKKGIGILFHVKGPDLRAVATEDNGQVWQDSCCEFFISDPDDGTYYNFEMNCIGTLLASKRKSREDCIHFSEEKLKRVRRFTTLEHKAVEISDKVFSWSVGMFIPFELVGIDPENIPSRLKANFYKCGDLTKHIHFLSWSPIDCPKPDFHRPDFFGTIELEPIQGKPYRKIISAVISPVMLSIYFIILMILCFWHFQDMSEASTLVFGIPLDKIIHFLLFFPLPLLGYATFVKKTRNRWKSMFIIIVIMIAGCIIGGLTEIIQGLTGYRSCDINDFRADAFGMTASTIITLIWDAIRRSARK